MSFFKSVALLAAIQAVIAAPTDLSKRQGGDGTIRACSSNTCSDCPFTLDTGDGWPQCIIYTHNDLAAAGFPVQDNGQAQIFFDVPPLDPGCSVIVRTPVVGSVENCGGNQLVAAGATCAPVPIDSTFVTLFCCGPDDCGAAGVPGRRDTSPNRVSIFGGTAQAMVLRDRDGNVIQPKSIETTTIESRTVPDPVSRKREVKKPAAAPHLAERELVKRCDNFRVTRDPYTSLGPNHIISDTVTCGPTESCSASVGGSVTESFGVEAGFEVSDPLGIVSASVSVSWEQSIERNWDTTFNFGPGETGYVVFIPVLTCVDGVFEGCGDGEVVSACGPTRSAGEMTGDVRGVTIRG